MLSSVRRGIVYPNPNRSDTADVPRDIGAVIAGLEIDVIYGQGTLAARPAFGIQGRIYEATDQTPKQFYWDNGTGWDTMGSTPYSDINRIGLLTNRPAANAVQSGTKYFATDQVVEYVSDGVNWLRLSDPAGTTTDWFSNTIPTGWVAYDSSNLPASTGIYADLYAHLGNVVATPDTRGRVTVAKGTHVDHDTVLKNDGLAVGLRRDKHKHTTAHTLILPDHAHSPLGNTYYQTASAGGAASSAGSGPGDIGGGGIAATTGGITSSPAIVGGVTVGPQTGNEPTDGPAYITCAYKIAKL